MPSKNPDSAYLQWMEPFFRGTTFPLVFFTTPDLIPVIAEWRSHCKEKTILISLPQEEMAAHKKWGVAWDVHALLDNEKNHSVDLYKIWYEKKEFVLRAIGMGAFQAERFVWCDAGILRFPEWRPYLINFPLQERIPAGKMTLLNIAAFEKGDTEDSCFDKVNRIGGGIQAADRDTWVWWSGEYDAMMKKYIASERFIGKDQSIMASVYLKFPERVELIKPPEDMHPIAKWFWLLLWFSGA